MARAGSRLLVTFWRHGVARQRRAAIPGALRCDCGKQIVAAGGSGSACSCSSEQPGPDVATTPTDAPRPSGTSVSGPGAPQPSAELGPARWHTACQGGQAPSRIAPVRADVACGRGRTEARGLLPVGLHPGSSAAVAQHACAPRDPWSLCRGPKAFRRRGGRVCARCQPRPDGDVTGRALLRGWEPAAQGTWPSFRPLCMTRTRQGLERIGKSTGAGAAKGPHWGRRVGSQGHGRRPRPPSLWLRGVRPRGLPVCGRAGQAHPTRSAKTGIS